MLPTYGDTGPIVKPKKKDSGTLLAFLGWTNSVHVDDDDDGDA